MKLPKNASAKPFPSSLLTNYTCQNLKWGTTSKLDDYAKLARLAIGEKEFGCGGRIRTFDLWVMLTTTAFAAWMNASSWSGLSLHPRPALPPLGCLPSSLYTFSVDLTATRAWLGVTPPTASPTLTGDRMRVSSRAAQCRIKSQASR